MQKLNVCERNYLFLLQKAESSKVVLDKTEAVWILTGTAQDVMWKAEGQEATLYADGFL